MAERVLERIRAEGPLSSRDFERESGAKRNWFGMPEFAGGGRLEWAPHLATEQRLFLARP